MREIAITPAFTDRTDASVNRYLNDIGEINLIDAAEEVRLAQKIRDGDLAAQNRLISANLRFVVSVAKKYQHQGISMADLISEGNLGLIKAAQCFDETRGFKFISYAVWWIRQSILAALNEQKRLVRLPMNQQLSMRSIIKESIKLEQILEREPTLAELAEVMDKTEKDLADVTFCNSRVSYLDDHIPGGETEDNNLLLYLHEDNPSEIPGGWMEDEDRKYRINKLLSCLSLRERIVLRLYYGLDGDYPMEDISIASEIGVSKETIRQVRRKALSKIREIQCPTS